MDEQFIDSIIYQDLSREFTNWEGGQYFVHNKRLLLSSKVRPNANLDVSFMNFLSNLSSVIGQAILIYSILDATNAIIIDELS